MNRRRFLGALGALAAFLPLARAAVAPAPLAPTLVGIGRPEVFRWYLGQSVRWWTSNPFGAASTCEMRHVVRIDYGRGLLWLA